jgi:tetratricopeptide (TPR) repeat protein
VRGVAIALSLLVATPASANTELLDPPQQPRADPDRGNFWRNMLWPHKDEVDQILGKARLAISNADLGLYAEYDPSGTERVRFFREAFWPLRYARTLAPDHIDVLRMLGHVADEHGRTREAIDALRTAIELVGIDKAGPEITGRLGIIYARMGKVDEALRYLRAAEGPLTPNSMLSAQVLVHLSHLLAARGRMSDAIDVLANALPTPAPQYYPNELALVMLALAVQYDRDEQPGAAFEILDRMHVNMQGQLVALGTSAFATVRFAPATDRHYYHGLLYEVGGELSEARAEFALYAAAGDQPYRGRALQHVAAIDALRRRGASSESQPLPPPRRRPAIPHPAPPVP